jgi:hypothetical protein
VGVDVINFRWRDTRFFKGAKHYLDDSGAFGMWRCNMVGIRRHTSADDLGIDLCSALFGVLVFFEDQRTGTFS